jgi:DNA-binding response OmpR family regulator
VTACNGRDGIVEFLRHREAVRLVITDEMMPEVGGTALVRALKALDTKLRFIAISGLDSQHEQLIAVGVRTILAKPCGPGILLDAVRAELTRPLAGAA